MNASAATTALSRLRVWVAASRPATLTAAAGPVFVGTAFAWADGYWHLGAAVAAVAGAMCIQVGTNLFNDYADFKKGADTPHRLGPARATERGWLTPGQVLAGAWVSFAMAAAIGAYLVTVAGWPIAAIGIAGIAAGVLYTGGPAPLGYVGLGDVFVMAFFGVVAVCGSYYVQAGEVTLPVLLASFAVGALATAILVVNNLRDRKTDGAAGKRTLVVLLGPRFGRAEYGALIFAAYALPVALAAHTQTWLLVLPLASLPLAVKETRRVLTRDGADLNAGLGGTARVGLVYCLLLSAGAVL